jgi:hypothetical protein
LRAFEPVAAEIRRREGFTGILLFQSISIFILLQQVRSPIPRPGSNQKEASPSTSAFPISISQID